METSFINVTIYDLTTKKSRTICLQSTSKLSQLRQIIQKQWDIKDFRFLNEGCVCIKGNQKHMLVQIFLKAYNTITIASQRQEPKKQSKIIEKSKKQTMIRYSLYNRLQQERNLANPSSVGKKLTSEDIMNQKYFKWTKQNIQYCKFKYNVQLSENGYGLDLDYITINIEDFIKHDYWSNIQWLSLYGCGIDDKSWCALVATAHLFVNLKILGLSKDLIVQFLEQNQITTIKYGDLQAFKCLKIVQFGTISGANPLTKQSKKYLKSFKQQHPQVKVKYRS